MADHEPPPKRLRTEVQSKKKCYDFTSDHVQDDVDFSMDHGLDDIRPNMEDSKRLTEFQVIDEVGEEDGPESENEDSDGSEEVPEDEIERMLEADLPENFKGPPKEKEKPYFTKHKLLMEEKGTNHFEVLPLDWLVVMHNSGIPVYLHKGSRVCTLSKPYFLGKGSVRKHEIPISSIPCLNYRRALEEEEKMKEINKKIAEQIKNANALNVEKEKATCPFKYKTNSTNDINNELKNSNSMTNNKDKSNNETIHCMETDNENNQTILALETVNEVNKPMDDMEMVYDDNKTINDMEAANENNETINNIETANENNVTINDVEEMNENNESSVGASENDEIIKSIEELTKTIEIGNEKSRPQKEDVFVFKKPFPPIAKNFKSDNKNKAHKVTDESGIDETAPAMNEETSSQKKDEIEIPASMKPVILPGGLVLPPARIETVQDNWKSQHLTHEQVTEYCRKLFKFKNVSVIHFKHWSDRRRYTKAKKAMQRPTLPEGTKLISIPAQPVSESESAVQGILGRPKRTQREWIMNMNGRSYVSVFHEYVRRALQKQPVYEFRQLENAATPYEATVLMDGMRYGVGQGSSKRQAKSAAARESILILIPEMKDQISKEEQSTKIVSGEPDLAFFDMVGIEDPRIMGFCTTTMEPSPHAILRTCLLRNFGTGDRHIQCEMKKLKHEKIEFTMTVGKHTASVVCKNKKMGKQRASQAILQALHPHVKSWGSLLRLYGSRSVKSCRDRKNEEQEITLLQDKATVNQPNYAILEKLKLEMDRLKQMDLAVVPIGTLIVEDDVPTLSGSSLNKVNM